jgi:hypothetical protein
MLDYLAFAARQSIGPDVAYVLPALFERTAPKVGMSPRALLAEATYANPNLGAYLADCARKVVAADRAEA